MFIHRGIEPPCAAQSINGKYTLQSPQTGGPSAMFNRPTTARGAFTLIELLVVISIIALLIGILLPALKGARDAAMSAQCKSQLRQQGQGYHMYAADNSDWMPPSGLASVIMRTGSYYGNPRTATTFGLGATSQGVGMLLGYPENNYNNAQADYLFTRDMYFCPQQDVVRQLDAPGTWAEILRGSNYAPGATADWIGYFWIYLNPHITGGATGSAYEFKYANDFATRQPYAPLVTDIGQKIWANIPGLDWQPSHPEGHCNTLYLDGHAVAVSLDYLNTTGATSTYMTLLGEAGND
jgi:prepilin-type N-terminal cleavage/methylation domain-containing protein/prepilin-type processing-associated H-X9-DG protein